MENGRMSRIERSYDNNISLDPWFVTGFSDGEAAFTYSKKGYTLDLYFAIRLREDDSILIHKIRDFFGAGKIYRGKGSPPKKYSGNSKPNLYYRVSNIIDLIKIIKHFDKYPPMSKKIASYRIWREMAILKQKRRYPDLEKLRELSQKLSSINSKSRKSRESTL